MQGRKNCSWKQGWRKIENKTYFFRSKWEANYAKYLNFLKNKEIIKNWEFEPRTFVFSNGINSYLPDFRILTNKNNIEYHEVKGWFDERSKRNIDFMKKEYPDIILKIIDEKTYKAIKNEYSNKIKDWEY